MAPQRHAAQLGGGPKRSTSPHNTTSAFTVLVFTRTQGYRHASIPAGIAAFEDLASRSRMTPTPFYVHATEDAIVFNSATLAQYRVIVFLQASGEFFDNEAQSDALKQFVREGGGIVGIHCASTGLPSSDYYGRLIGAVFTDHPEPQNGVVIIEDLAHPIISHLAASRNATKANNQEPASATRDTLQKAKTVEHRMEWFDEWYNFKSNPRSQEGVRVLMSVTETSYRGGTMGDDHPIAWCQEFDGGRSFYTALGHFDEAYTDTSFLKTILNGLLWAAHIGN